MRSEVNDVVSVVVPACNEEDYLGDCLESLRRQAGGGNYEIIIVDNGSTDATSRIAGTASVRVISEPQRGVGVARSAGFAAARGTIIASTDADTVVPEDWLRRIRELFDRNPTAVAVGGFYVLSDGPAIQRSLYGVARRLMPFLARACPWLWGLSGANFAVRASAYQACGGFDRALKYGDDVDLWRRLRRTGPVVHEPTLLVQTSGRAFYSDVLGLRTVVNYFSFLCFGRAVLPVAMGTNGNGGHRRRKRPRP